MLLNIVGNSVVYMPRNSQCTVSLLTEPVALSAISQMSDEHALSFKNEGIALLKSKYGTFCLWSRLHFETPTRVKDPKTERKNHSYIPSCGCSIFNEGFFLNILFTVTSFSPGESHKMDTEVSHCTQCAHCQVTFSLMALKMGHWYYRYLNIMHVFLSVYILTQTFYLRCLIYDSQWKSTQTSRSVLFSTPVPHSNHWLWQAADGVLYSDLLLHSRGCSTFCEPLSSWIIDGILSVGCVGFHILSIEWKYLACYVFLQGFLVFNC